MYATIAVTRNMHQIAARKYDCIESLHGEPGFETILNYIALSSGNCGRKTWGTSDHNRARRRTCSGREVGLSFGKREDAAMRRSAYRYQPRVRKID